MSDIKELRFFQDPGCLDKLDTYATFFDGNAPVRGESSPIYTSYPLVLGVPDRIRAAIPGVKLIYVVRDPVERCISSYDESRAARKEFRAFEEATRDIDNPYNRYIAAGKYATQLEQYMPFFSLSQLLVIDQSDLLARPHRTLRKVFRFLEVDEEFVSPEFEKLHRTRASKRHWSAIGLSLRRSRLAHAARALPAGPRRVLFGSVRSLSTRRVEPSRMDPEVRERFRDAYREEADRLRRLTGQGFTSWQV
jgi:hypothetical protein